MIDPAVPIVHLDADGVRRLMSLVVRRQVSESTQLTVLHEAGRVISVVHSRDGHLLGHRGLITDPVAAAGALRRSAGVDRVVMLDRARLDDLAAAVVEAARRLPSQGDLLLEAHDLYWHHPAVVTDPAPPASSWAPVRDLLRALPDGWLHLSLGDDPRLDAHVLVRSGWVAAITGRDPGAGAVLRVVLGWDDVEAITAAADPVAALADALDRLAQPAP